MYHDSVTFRVLPWLFVYDMVRCRVCSDSYAASDAASDRGAYVVTVDGKNLCFMHLSLGR